MNLKHLMNVWIGDRWARWFVGGLVLLNGFGWLAVWYGAPRNLDVSPLHYTIYFGINLTGHWTSLFWLPAIGLTALLSHLFIARMVEHVLWRRLWLVLAAAINIMVVIDLTAMLILLRTTTF